MHKADISLVVELVSALHSGGGGAPLTLFIFC